MKSLTSAMHQKFILSSYIDKAISKASYEKLEDGSYAGKIAVCKGVIAFGKTLRECEMELHSTLEEWIVMGLKFGHKLPVIDGLNLNKKPAYEPMDTL